MLALDHNDTVTSCHMGLSPQHHYHLLGAHGFPNTRAPHLSLNPYRCSHSKIWYYMHTWPVTKLGLSYPSWVSESPSVVSDSLQPHELYILAWILQARILEGVAFPFSRGSSQPKDRIQVSYIAGGFFTSWVTREAQEYWLLLNTCKKNQLTIS